MQITARHFLVVKDGSPPEQNDDSAELDLARRRFAISDGATESGFSRVWSRLLVEQFVRHFDGSPDDWPAWLPSAQQRWLDALQGVPIPWYGEDQFQQGSFATFLGVVLHAPANGGGPDQSENGAGQEAEPPVADRLGAEAEGAETEGAPADGTAADRAEDIPSNGAGQLGAESVACDWQAVAVGDSCLFHTRAGELLSAFPLQHSSQFDSFPKLVGSRSPVESIGQKRSVSVRGAGQARDHLWLSSDALSKWCLAETESGRPPWEELAEFLLPATTDDQFAAWINHLRATRGLDNDDVTLLVIEL